MISWRTTKSIRKDNKKRTKRHSVIWNSFVSNRREFSFLINVVTDVLLWRKIIALISPLASTPNFSTLSLWKSEKRFNLFIRFNQVDSEDTIHNRNFYDFKCCIVQLPNNFALISAQWIVLLCLKRQLKKIHFSSSVLGSTISWTLGQPCPSSFPPLYPLISRNSSNLLSFCKLFTFYISRKNVGNLAGIWTTIVLKNSMQIFGTPIVSFVGL